MMKAKDLIPALIKKEACQEAMQWLRSHLVANPDATVQQAWDNCRNAAHMIWFAQRFTGTRARTYVQIALACVRETNLDDGRVVADLLADPRSIDALELVERWLADKHSVTRDELDAAAHAVTYAAADAATYAAHAVTYAAHAVTYAAAHAATYAAAAHAATYAAHAVADAAYAAADAQQADIVRRFIPRITLIETVGQGDPS